jgi:hypothetical protein
MAQSHLTSLQLNGLPVLGLRPEHLTTAQINALAGGALYTGRLVYDSSLNVVKYYDGAAWQDITGDVRDVIAGTGISVSSAAGAFTVTNSDRGSSQNIYKTFTDGTVSATAASNSDTFKFRGTGGATVTVTNNDATHGDNVLIGLSAIPNTSLANSSITVTAGNGLTTGGTVALGGSVTLNVGTSLGSGISVAADTVNLTNYTNFTANNLQKWDGSQFVNSTITDDGTTVTIGGNLTINGTVTYINSNTVEIGDNIILLNRDEAGVPSQNAGFEIERGTSANVSVLWNETTDRWTFTNNGTTFYNIPISTEYNNYVHPTQTAISRNGGGLSFLADITVNTLGHVTAVTLDTIQSATEAQKGVVELATAAETTTGTSTTLATHPAGVKAAIDAAIASAIASTGYAETIGDGTVTSYIVTHALGTDDVIVQLFAVATGETVYADVIREGEDDVTIAFAVAPSLNSIRVLVSKIS